MPLPPKKKKNDSPVSNTRHSYSIHNRTGEDIDMLHEKEMDPQAGPWGSDAYKDDIDGA